MSCNRGVHLSDAAAAAEGVPALEANWSTGRGGPRQCGECGGWLRDDGGCTKCENGAAGFQGIYMAPEEKAAIDEAESLARYLQEGGIDPLNNDGVRRLHSNYVSISSGRDREVVLDPGHPTASTDLGGTVYLNPYPLGARGKVLDQMIVAQSYIDHELLHELWTPRECLDTIIGLIICAECKAPLGDNGRCPKCGKIQGVSANLAGEWARIQAEAADLSAGERQVVKDMLNILEDGRIERLCEQNEPFVWERMLAGQSIYPKDGHARNGGLARLQPWEQVMWATQIEVQPNYWMTEDIKAGMAPEAYQTLLDIDHLIEKAGFGTAVDATESAIAITRELKKRGMLDDLTRTPDAPQPHQAGGSSNADGSVKPQRTRGDCTSGGRSQPQADGEGKGGGQQTGGSGSSQSKQQDGQEQSGGGSSQAGGKKPDGEQRQGGSGSKADGEKQEGEQPGSGSGGTEEMPGEGQERCPECGAFKTPGQPCANCGGEGSGDKGEEKDAAGGNNGEAVAAGQENAAANAGNKKDDTGNDSETGEGDKAGEGNDEAGEGDADEDGDGEEGEGDKDKANGETGPGGAANHSWTNDPDSPPPPVTTPPASRPDKPEISHGPGGSSPETAEMGGEEDGAVRERREEMERLAEEALRRARERAITDYRSAAKTVVKNAERAVAKKVAKGPAKGQSMAITIPFVDENGKQRPQRVNIIDGLPEGQVYSYVEGRYIEPREQRRYLDEDRDIIGTGGRQMSARLKKMKMNVEKTAYLQKKGNLDRRRMTAAVKGSDRIRMQEAPNRDLSMAVSMEVDMSGSMTVSARRIGTVVGMISRGLEGADVVYETRVYTEEQYHVKKFDDPYMSDDNLRRMYKAWSANDDPVAIHLGGLALLDRPEPAKIQFVITDGEPSCGRMRSDEAGKSEVKYAVQKNRERGIITLGIFYARPSGATYEQVKDKFDLMYGKGNWAYIQELEDLPRIVTSTLENQLAQHLPRDLK